MLHRTTRVACAAIALLAGAAHAAGPYGTTGEAYPEDCFNDNNAVRNDFEPAATAITDADVAALLAQIAASEQRRVAAREAREPAGEATPAPARSGG